VSCTQGNRTGCQYEPSAGRVSMNDAEEKGYELKGCKAGTGTPETSHPTLGGNQGSTLHATLRHRNVSQRLYEQTSCSPLPYQECSPFMRLIPSLMNWIKKAPTEAVTGVLGVPAPA